MSSSPKRSGTEPAAFARLAAALFFVSALAAGPRPVQAISLSGVLDTLVDVGSAVHGINVDATQYDQCKQNADCPAQAYPTFCMNPRSDDFSTLPTEIRDFLIGIKTSYDDLIMRFVSAQCVPWPVTTDPNRTFCTKDADCSEGNKCYNALATLEAILKAAAPGSTLSSGWCYSPITASDALAVDRAAAEVELIKPKLEIPIPFVDFTSAVRDDRNITVPFLAQYVTGVYKFLLSIVGVLVTVMLMIGGFQYLTAGGDKGRVEAGKKRIQNALFGFILAFGSYTMLWSINPALVRFEAFGFMAVAPDSLNAAMTGAYDTDNERDMGEPPAPLTGDALDPLYTAYAACLGIEPATLKAIAYAESGLKPDSRTKDGCTDGPNRNCFVGLFQLYRPFCEGKIDDIQKKGIRYLQEVLQSKEDCTVENRLIPEVNIALYALQNMQKIEDVRKACGTNISLRDFILTLYVHHNNGPGVGGYVVARGSKGSCIYAGQAQDTKACNTEHAVSSGLGYYVREFYEKRGSTNAINQAAGQKVCPLERLTKHGPANADENTRWYGACITADYGEKKMCHGFNIFRAASKWGATRAFVPRDLNTCPLTAGSKDKWVLPNKGLQP